MALELDGKIFATDAEGFLSNAAEWTRELAEKMATEDGISLGPEHWEAIDILRDYYAKYAIAPPIRILIRQMGKRLGKEKVNSPYLYELFPLGPAKQACRYAGLPKPTGCI